MQDISVGLECEEFRPYHEMTPETNAPIIEDFLNQLPETIDLVSFLFDDPKIYEMFLEKA